MRQSELGTGGPGKGQGEAIRPGNWEKAKSEAIKTWSIGPGEGQVNPGLKKQKFQIWLGEGQVNPGLKNQKFQPGTFELLALIKLNKGKKTKVPKVPFWNFWCPPPPDFLRVLGWQHKFLNTTFFGSKSVRHQKATQPRTTHHQQHKPQNSFEGNKNQRFQKKTYQTKDSRHKLASHGYEEACSCCQSRNFDPNQAWRRQTSCHT